MRSRSLLAGALLLPTAGCAPEVNVRNNSDYHKRQYMSVYKAELEVEIQGAMLRDSPEVFIDGAPYDLTRVDESNVWEHSYPDLPDLGAPGLHVHFRVPWTSTWLFIPYDKEIRLPYRNSFIVPILGRDSDIDGDGIMDRNDQCPFHAGTLCQADPTGHRALYFEQTGSEGYQTKMKSLDGGNFVLEQDQVRYRAFRRLIESRSKVYSASQFPGLENADFSNEATEPVELTLSDCGLVYQDDDGGHEGRFVQVYGQGLSSCSLELTRGDVSLLDGTDVLVLVVTNNNPGSSNFGTARAHGRVTLEPPDTEDQAVFAQVTDGVVPEYAYFDIWDYTATDYDPNPGDPINATGTFRGSGRLFVEIPQN